MVGSKHDLRFADKNKFLCFSALNNDGVWADGLLVFYEVFKFLEENVSQQILPTDFHRSSEFEKGKKWEKFNMRSDFNWHRYFVADLKFFKGDDWEKTYKVRPSVQKYLSHLNEVNEKNPLLLIAYVYHLYMGLLSGGQILSKKRKLSNKFFGEHVESDEIEPGTFLTSYPDKSILQLKNQMRHNIDEFTKDFDENLRQELIEESKKVFELNNEIIKSVEGVGAQLKRNALKISGISVLVILSFYLFIKMLNF